MSTTPTLRPLRDALRGVHQALLQSERREYERSFGRIASDVYLLQLAAEDPQFAWLRALASLMLDVDAMVARGDEPSATDLRLLATQVRALVLPDDPMTPFQHRYQRALQEDPAVVMAHSAVVRTLPPASPVRIFRGSVPERVEQVGSGKIRLFRPGRLVPGLGDHGYGPLALVADVALPSGAEIPLREHRNEVMLSWVAHGAVRNEDTVSGESRVDPDHPLAMRAGRGVSSALRVPEDDSPVRLLQVFVRPAALDLEPSVRQVTIPRADAGAWRLVAGPEDGEAPLRLRDGIEVRDAWLDAGDRVALPVRPGWHSYLFVVGGEVALDGVPVAAGEQAIVRATGRVALVASEPAVLLLALVDRSAKVTRAGTCAR